MIQYTYWSRGKGDGGLPKKVTFAMLFSLVWVLVFTSQAADTDASIHQWLQLQNPAIAAMLFRGEAPAAWDITFATVDTEFSKLGIDREKVTGILAIHTTLFDNVVVTDVEHPGCDVSISCKEVEGEGVLFDFRYYRKVGYNYSVIGLEPNGLQEGVLVETSLWGKMAFAHPSDASAVPIEVDIDLRIDSEKRDMCIQTFLQQDSPYFTDEGTLTHELQSVLVPDARRAIEQSLPIAPLTNDDAQWLADLVQREEILQEIFEEKVPAQLIGFTMSEAGSWESEDKAFLYKNVELTHRAKGISLEYEFEVRKEMGKADWGNTSLWLKRFSTNGAQRSFCLDGWVRLLHDESSMEDAYMDVSESKEFDGEQEIDDYVLCEYYLHCSLDRVTRNTLVTLLSSPDGLIKDGKISPLYAGLLAWSTFENE